jgi:DnaJ domain
LNTHYDTIGVDYDADPAAIRAAYERRTVELRRDQQQARSNERAATDAAIVELDAAFTVLGNDTTRKNYDSLLADRALSEATPTPSTSAMFHPIPASWQPPPSLHDAKLRARITARAASTGIDRWWLPLLIPAVFLTLTSVSGVISGAHVVDQTPIGAAAGSIILALLIVWPAFAAGVRYHRSHSD